MMTLKGEGKEICFKELSKEGRLNGELQTIPQFNQ